MSESKSNQNGNTTSNWLAGQAAKAHANREPESECKESQPPTRNPNPSRMIEGGTEVKCLVTRDEIDLLAGIEAIVLLREALDHASTWYQLEHQRRVSPLSAQDARQHEQIERHYGRPYLRRLIMGSEKGSLLGRFDIHLRVLIGRIDGLDMLLGRPGFKPSAGLKHVMTEEVRFAHAEFE